MKEYEKWFVVLYRLKDNNIIINHFNFYNYEEKGDKMIDDEQKRYTLLVKTIRTISDENKELDKQLEKIMHGNELEYEKLDDTQIYTIIHDDVETINIDKDYEHRGGKFVEIIFKDTTIYKYHLLKYGNYDRIYIIDNDKEMPAR